ncbi:MAG: metallophosphoesterase [Armatimonadota bacterium]|nr:metallophosphoesterase [Armatimonadota bacterium]
MTIYAIADLHLSLGGAKPMDVFGPEWKDHAERIRRNWDAAVSDSDLVLVPGDISWAMRAEEALPDLRYLADRPGRKILVRGNHDYWWRREKTARLRQMVDPSITLLHGEPLVLDGIGITGTRGWALGSWAEWNSEEQNRKIYDRELDRLKQGLEALPDGLDLKIVMLHFPPFSENLEPNEFLQLAQEYSANILVYGHMHVPASVPRLEGDVGGVQLFLVAADNIGFAPKVIMV